LIEEAKAHDFRPPWERFHPSGGTTKGRRGKSSPGPDVACGGRGDAWQTKMKRKSDSPRPGGGKRGARKPGGEQQWGVQEKRE